MQVYGIQVSVNPLLPIAHKSARIHKISILKLEGIIQKISYERRDYESVDEKSLSKAMSWKTTKKNSGTKGLKRFRVLLLQLIYNRCSTYLLGMCLFF